MCTTIQSAAAGSCRALTWLKFLENSDGVVFEMESFCG
ncbi:hypothetical protein CPter91_2691 [Collimonas pratensis]|uniref:Uncharacterized protein n=1 Tax=Collimonas pratensis TaxID=279113 RepID=A0A127Q4R5_9BURK|nr:hypothetical protein CPter91_2691 [Collimonas pratensis]